MRNVVSVDLLAMATSAENNETCELLRQLAVSLLYRDDNDDRPATFTAGRLAGSEKVKYLLTEVVNPALCVVNLPDSPGGYIFPFPVRQQARSSMKSYSVKQYFCPQGKSSSSII